MTSVYKIKIGRQGRIVLPKELREAYGVDAGDEAVILIRGKELSLRLRKVSKDRSWNLLYDPSLLSV